MQDQFSLEEIDAICDLWPKYGLTPIHNFAEYAADGQLVSGCLITVQALQAGCAVVNLPQTMELAAILGLSLTEFWYQVCGFDRIGDDVPKAQYQFGKAVARRLTERGLWADACKR